MDDAPALDLLACSPSDLTFVVGEPGAYLYSGAGAAHGGELVLRYRVEGPGGLAQDLTETITLPPAPPAAPAPDPDAVRRALRLLACAAALSYYKGFVPSVISVPGGLTPGEREFLTTVVRYGLGEFAYRNDLPDALHPRIEAPELPEWPAAPATSVEAGETARPSALVAVGGGKDSIVTIEALRSVGVEQHLFSVNTYAPIERTAEVAALPHLVARRRLDPALFAFNDAGAHNGHVPVTAVNSLVGVLTALRHGLDAVVFSNEASSSYGNLSWHGTDINHQWSKGLAFERLLGERLAGTGVEYLSLLRPWTELAITRRFATHTAYRHAFTSCNRSFHLDPALRRSWCGECPKCVFVGLMLAPFVPRDELRAVLGGEPVTAPGNRDLLLDLLGVGAGHKPFECVGEPRECVAALGLLDEHPDWREDPWLADLRAEQPALARPSAQAVAHLFEATSEHRLTGVWERAARAVG